MANRCFRRFQHGRHVLEPGDRPQALGSIIPGQRAWKAFLRSSDAKNAICVARRFEKQLARMGGAYSQVAEGLGVSLAMVCYHLALLRRLPPDFVAWLEANEDPSVLAYFTERRLRSVCRIADPEGQIKRLSEMMEEVSRTATSPNA